MRRVGLVLGLLLLLVVLAVGAVWVALQRVDWDRFKAPIADAAHDATGRRLDLDGDLDLEVGLVPTVHIADVRFANADWGSQPSMVTLDDLSIHFRLWPLLGGELVVRDVELTGLEVVLETRADGVGNWRFEAAPPAGDAAKEAEATDAPDPAAPASDGGTQEADPGPSESAAAPRPLAVLLRRATVRDARLVVRDLDSGDEQRFEISTLHASSEGRQQPLSLDLEARYGDAPVRLEGELQGLDELTEGGPLGLDLRVEAGGGRLAILGEVADPLEEARPDLDLRFSAPSLAPLGAVVASELPAIGPVALELQLEGHGDGYRAEALELTVGKSRIEGGVELELAGERPRIEALLSSPQLYLDDFQAGDGAPAARVRPAPGIQLASESAGEAPLFSRDPLPLDGLDGFDAMVHLEVDRLGIDSLRLDNFASGLSLENGLLEVRDLGAGLARGRLDAGARLDTRRSPAALSLTGRTRGVHVGDLSKALGREEVDDGPLDLDFDLRSRGGSLHEIAAGLAGRIELVLGHAVVRNEYAAIAQSDLKELVRGGVIDAASVECAWGDFSVEKGVATPEALVIDLSSIALFGKGWVDLGRERMKLEFDRQAQRLTASAALPPFVLEGPLSDPKAGVSTAALVARVVDLSVELLDGGENAMREPAAGCKQLFARYREQSRRDPSEVARRAADGLRDKEKREKALKKLKGLFD